MLPAGKARIAQMATDLRRFRQLESIRVTGHADRIGTPENNQRLSLARAKTVSQFLVSLGIDETRVFVSGEGETKPVVDCPGAVSPAIVACLGANRRVELEIRGTR
jgi:OmpA-OmpF porin, OOP family